MTANDAGSTPPPNAIVVGYREETKRLGFWISQLFILLATVLGVYLASSQGFKQAMAFGEIQSDRANYFLRKSLHGELSDNLPLVREYMKRIATGNLADRKAPFRLDTFVWESLKSSSSALETPPSLLRECRLFYRGVADIQEKIANNTYGAKTGTEKLGELADRLEKNVLPLFSANIDELKAGLEKRGVMVE